MRYRFLIVISACLAARAAPAIAADLPVYEVKGLPLTPHQLALLGPAGAEQRQSDGIPTLAGMPASPHQIAVLTPRRKILARPIESDALDHMKVGARFTPPEGD